MRLNKPNTNKQYRIVCINSRSPFSNRSYQDILIPLVLLVFLTWASDFAHAQSQSVFDILDGRTFKAGIASADSDSNKSLEDVLSFSNGMFSSIVCKQYNFRDAPYWIRTEGEIIHFLAELKSTTDGTMVWQGKIVGNNLEGIMRWTKNRWYWTIDTEHKIRGELDLDKGSASSVPN